MRSSYLDYAMSVIVGRALPDVRDGLKPVHRRVLFAMNESGPAAQPAATASAPRVVGDVMGNYHPHGDSGDLRHARAPGAGLRACATRWSTARATSARSTTTRPAAMRYTEARLAPLATRDAARPRRRHGRLPAQLRRLATRSRSVLPARFPNLLVNGSSGIAVGMATNIPPHNLREAIDAVDRLHRRPGHRHRRA